MGIVYLMALLTARSPADHVMTTPSGNGPLSVAFAVGAWPPDAAPNGVLTYVAEISKGLKHDGHQVSVMSLVVKDGADPQEVYDVAPRPIRPRWRALGRKIARRFGPRRDRWQDVGDSLVAATHRAIAEKGLQLLEMEEAFGWPRLVGPLVPIPVVVHLHGPWFINGPLRGAVEDDSFRERVAAEKEAIVGARAVTAPSRDILDRTRAYYGVPLSEAVVIPYACPVVPRERRWRAAECDPSLVLFVGRFDLHKGGDVMIDAFVKVMKARPEARLVFVGPDEGLTDEAGRRWDMRSYLAARANRAWAEGRIEWLGRQPGSTLAQLRARAAVTVVASRYDNYPLTVLEAMSFGSPLVASRIGGIAEVVEDGVHGLLCPPGDANALAAAIVRLLEAPAFAAGLGERAGDLCERAYHPTSVARRRVEYYRSLLDHDGGRSPAR